MSNKKNIGNLADIISSCVSSLSRDYFELEKLQSGGALISERFAIAAYKKFSFSLIEKISKHISAYKILVPKNILSLNNGVSSYFNTTSILDFSQFSDIGDENIGYIVINPISSLVNLIRSIPSFSVGIAILIKEEYGYVYNQGIIYDIMNNKFYTATNGAGTFMNNVKTTYSLRSKIYTSFISISGLELMFKDSAGNSVDDAKKNAILFKNMSIIAANNISLPVELALCYLSSGKIDIVVDLNIKDSLSLVPGLIIAKESGCFILDCTGKEISFSDVFDGKFNKIIVTNKSIVDDVVKFLKN